MEKKIKEFIGKATYGDHLQMIFGVQKSGHHQKLADLRGWGAIQNLFIKYGKLDVNKAKEFQDALGQWIVDAINEKLCKASKI